MSKCENCIHEGMCRFLPSVAKNIECRFFKDKSLFVELPCKVGGIVYAPHWHWGTYINGDIMPYQITNITIIQNKKGVWTKKYRAMEVQNGKTIDWQLNFEFDAIGKSVFLTKEDAEAKLKETENV